MKARYELKKNTIDVITSLVSAYRLRSLLVIISPLRGFVTQSEDNK